MNDDDLKAGEIQRRSLKEAGLTEDQLTVVYLRIQHGMTIQAVAKELHMTVAAVEQLDDEARERVAAARKRIADEERDVDLSRRQHAYTRH
jgi:transcriptional regulator